jgi:hypothetical protein
MIREMMIRMWWNHQNLNSPRRDKAGTRWHFRVWHDIVDGHHRERVFFWDDDKKQTGVVLLGDSLHVTRLHALIDKLVADPAIRQVHRRDLKFPVERHYARYEPFPEEVSTPPSESV